jgi:Polysaccharide deacetylase
MTARLPIAVALLMLASGAGLGCKGHQDAFTPPGPIEVAITVDDLPRHGQDIPGVSRLAIHQQLLEVLKRHHVPSVYGFVVGSELLTNPEDAETLLAWLQAGYPLGNHTYTHADAAKVSVEDFLSAVADEVQEPVELMPYRLVRGSRGNQLRQLLTNVVVPRLSPAIDQGRHPKTHRIAPSPYYSSLRLRHGVSARQRGSAASYKECKHTLAVLSHTCNFRHICLTERLC